MLVMLVMYLIMLLQQAQGHEMEAVPSSPRTDASERRAEGRYFKQLQQQAEALKEKDARRQSII